MDNQIKILKTGTTQKDKTGELSGLHLSQPGRMLSILPAKLSPPKSLRYKVLSSFFSPNKSKHKIYYSKDLRKFTLASVLLVISQILLSSTAALSSVPRFRSVEVCLSPSHGTASWYDTASCIREGTNGHYTASGEAFDETARTCALPSYNFGGHYRVTNLDNFKSIIVRHTDYGPNKKLVEGGRIIDLSKGAFEKIADLDRGLIRVRVDKLGGEA